MDTKRQEGLKIILKGEIGKKIRYPEILIKPSSGGAYSNHWGEFIYGPGMPWGPWHLTNKSKELFRSKNVVVLECFADEYIEDEQGFVAKRTLENDPCSRHFLVGLASDGSVLWWHNLGEQRYDFENKRFYETVIRIKGKKIIIKGYS